MLKYQEYLAKVIIKASVLAEKKGRGILYQIQLSDYQKSDRRPWRNGYNQYKELYINDTLTSERLVNTFRNNKQLPANYGVRLDARVVEIPWVICKLMEIGSSKTILDAGSSLNYEYLIKRLVDGDHNLVIMTLGPEKKNFNEYGISYMYGDLRQTYIQSNTFDYIVCISTIEHVGMDNSRYVKPEEMGAFDSPNDYIDVITEFKRILKPGGRLFITFPFGKYNNFGWFQQFNSDMVDKLISIFHPSDFQEIYYQYTSIGWVLSDRASCKDAEFFDINSLPNGRLSTIDQFPHDIAAAERAVACLSLLKGKHDE